MHFDLQPTLENDLLMLRPLKKGDFEDLYNVASDPFIWDQHPDKNRCQHDVFTVFFNEAVKTKGAFVVIDKKTNEVIGSTRFCSVKETSNAIEIGWTFLGRQYWGGYYNTSMKNLMMDYAFNFVENIIFHIMNTTFALKKL